jgi:hypothetical protein
MNPAPGSVNERRHSRIPIARLLQWINIRVAPCDNCRTGIMQRRAIFKPKIFDSLRN